MDIFKKALKTCDSCDFTFPSKSNANLSQVDHYLTAYPGNHVALAEDVPLIEDHIFGLQNDIIAYDIEIQRISNVLAQLNARRNALSRAERQFKSLTRPSIRRLPADILLHIFLLYLESEKDRPACAPVLCLGSVCSEWRTLVHTFSFLWATIRYEDPFVDPPSSYPDVQRHDRYGPLVQFCLEKSGSVPIKVYLAYELNWVSFNHARVWEELMRHSNRWRVLSIDNYSFESFPTNLPILEELVLSGFTVAFAILPERVSTPALRRISLTGNLVSFGTRFDVSSLTSLSVLGSFRFPLFLALLKQCPTLRVLDIKEAHLEKQPSGESDPLTNGSSPTPLSTVRSLTVDVAYPERFHSFSDTLFGYLTFPSLKILSMAIPTGPYTLKSGIDRDGPVFHQITSPPLTSLDLCGIAFREDQDILDFLTSLPSTLSQLRLAFCDFPAHSDTFLQKLTLPNDEGSEILPYLTVLDLSGTPLEFKDASLLPAMVESRWRVEESQERKRLSRVHFTWKENRYHAVSSRLETLSDEGLRVEFTSALEDPW